MHAAYLAPDLEAPQGVQQGDKGDEIMHTMSR